MKHLVLIFTLMASPAAAYDICDELWFIRNLTFDRAGYCFGSTLGQALFDNANCVTKNPTLSRDAQATVAKLGEMEDWMGCDVDTSQRYLDLPNEGFLRQLQDLPVPTDTGSGCIGWRGPDVPLRAGHDMSAPILSVGRAGANIIWNYDWVDAPGWEFLSVTRDGVLIGMGWSNSYIDPELCTQLAG